VGHGGAVPVGDHNIDMRSSQRRDRRLLPSTSAILPTSWPAATQRHLIERRTLMALCYRPDLVNFLVSLRVWTGGALQEKSVRMEEFGLASMYPAFGWS